MTTAPAVKAALKAMFAKAVEPSTQVWWPRPNEERQIEENVYIGAVHGEAVWAQLGRPQPRAREENYTVDVDVEVYRQGSDAQGTEERLWTVLGQLEVALEADETLGNLTNVQWALFSRVAQETTAANDGLLSYATLAVSVKARI